MPRLPGWLALVVAVTAISWASILARLAGVHGVVATWWRLLVGIAVTVVLLRVAGGGLRRGGLLYPLAAGAALSLHFSLWLESLNHTSVAVSTAIVTTYPVFTILADWAMGVRPRARRVLGVALSLAGIYVLARPWTGGGELVGALLALGGSVAGAAYFSLGRAARSRGYPVLDYTLKTYTAAWLFSTVYAVALGLNPLSVPPVSLPYLILLGIVPMILGHTMLNYALRYYTATLVTSVTLLEPFGATLLAVLVLSEVPDPLTPPGMVLAVAGTWLVVATEKEAT